MATKRVLSVGQCGADHGSISAAVRKHFDADVVSVDTASDALDLARSEPFDLVLVNRVFDADGGSGIGLIKQLRADDAFRQVPVLLVSNYDNAQREAVAAGAAPGFGKAALGQPSMVSRLKSFLG